MTEEFYETLRGRMGCEVSGEAGRVRFVDGMCPDH
jgi:hypothetical protein